MKGIEEQGWSLAYEIAEPFLQKKIRLFIHIRLLLGLIAVLGTSVLNGKLLGITVVLGNGVLNRKLLGITTYFLGSCYVFIGLKIAFSFTFIHIARYSVTGLAPMIFPV